MRRQRELPQPQAMREAEFYSHELEIELLQARDEGLDLRETADLIRAVAAMPSGTEKEKAADAVYDCIRLAGKRRGYPFREPSDRKGIFALCESGYTDKQPDQSLPERIRGAWYGRIAGCLLGKPLEGIRTDELIPLLNETGSYREADEAYGEAIRLLDAMK